MSRCFPFPPPGYDKKPRPEDTNALKEEKKKEKKHKKEKKDKEKREGKEKRDKERSEGKHKEKRDKKDKHKDKKDKHKEKKKEKEKEKDRGKEKEKGNISEVSRVVGIPDAKSAEKLGVQEGTDNNNYLDDQNCAAKFHGQNGERTFQSNLIVRETEESKYVQELGRRIRDEEKVTANQPERLSGAEKRRDDERDRFAVRNLGNSAEGKGKSKDRQVDIWTVEGQGFREEARFTGNSTIQSFAGAAKTKVSGIPAVLEKKDEKRMEGKEKTKEKDEKRGGKHNDRDKKGHGKEKDKEKERKKEEKVKEKSELDMSEDITRNNLTGATNKGFFSLSVEHNNNAKAELNLKKRKDIGINGVLHDNEIRPNKLLRPASHPVMENGRKLEASQTPISFASDTTGAAANLKGDNKEHRKNGMVESQSLPVPKQKSPAAIVADQILEISKKPPHPDTKYLSQVLSVPKLDEWSDLVDHDWLLVSQDPSSRKPEVCSVGIKEPQVWAEARHLESTDILALPYVLPY